MKIACLCILMSFARFGLSQSQFNIKFSTNSKDSAAVEIHQSTDTSYLNFSCKAGKSNVSFGAKDLVSFNQFLNDYSYQHSSNDMYGGIKVSGTFSEGLSSEYFSFRNPKKGHSNYILIQHIFKLLNDSVTEPAFVIELENLEQNFNLGLGVKQIKEKPLSYKLYGSITANNAEELYRFLYTLPKNQSIYLDMSNFKSMGTMFYKTFRGINNSHDLYWINCSGEAIYHLGKAGIRGNKVRR